MNVALSTHFTWYAYLFCLLIAMVSLYKTRENLFPWLAKALEESEGVPSSIRLQLLLATVCAVVLPIITWIGACAYAGDLVAIPASVASFCFFVYGTAVTGKVMQYDKEPDFILEEPEVKPQPHVQPLSS